MSTWTDWIGQVLGPDGPANDLLWYQVLARGALVFIAGLVIIRAGNTRFLGKNTVFDILLGIMLGATLSRAVNGSAPFFETLMVGALLVFLHGIVAYLAFNVHWFGKLVKGEPDRIVSKGVVDQKAMTKHRLTQGDLEESMRESAHTDSLAAIKEARVERNGSVSIVKAPAHVVDVKVEDGVQTVRIRIE